MSALAKLPSVPVFVLKDDEEILGRIKSIEPSDMFGFRREALVLALSFDAAREFLKDGASREGWGADATRDKILALMIDYLSFAWGKALDHRGLSALRSIQKIGEWLWILGDQEAHEYVTDEMNYQNYGAPALGYVSNRYSAPIPGCDEARNMATGGPCEFGCDEEYP